MKIIFALIKRNIKLFFKDKGMFFVSLITPGILLVLYATFLKNVYRDSFIGNIPSAFAVPDSLIDGLVGGQLISSILAVSCVTVAFCSNFLMVQDRAVGTSRDLTITPVSSSSLAISYYASSFISTLAICYVATAICLVYIAIVGWYFSFADVLLMLVDVFVLVLFGTAISSVVNFFLSTQGQISAVGTIISSGYGFISGAYMPISSFGEGLRTAIMFLPGTYGTSLLRNRSMRGVFENMREQGLPEQVIESLRDSIDCNIYFFDKSVPISVMYIVLAISIAAFVFAYVLLNRLKKR